MDLSVNALLQLIALGYGVYVIAQARPVFVVARVDRLVLVSADQLSDAHLAKGDRALFRRRSWTGPVRVAAVPPVGAAAGDLALQVLRDGIDIDRRSAYYEPWDQGIGTVLAHATPLAQLHTATPAQREKLHARSNALPATRCWRCRCKAVTATTRWLSTAPAVGRWRCWRSIPGRWRDQTDSAAHRL